MPPKQSTNCHWRKSQASYSDPGRTILTLVFTISFVSVAYSWNTFSKKIEIEKNMDSTNGEKIFQDILERAIDFQAHTFIEYQNGLWNRATARPSEQITHISCLLLDHRHIYPEAFVYRDGAYVAKREIPVLCAAEGQMRFEKLHQEFVKLGLIQEDAQVDDEDEGGDGDDEYDDGDNDA